MAYGDGSTGHLSKIIPVLLPYLHRELTMQSPGTLFSFFCAHYFCTVDDAFFMIVEENLQLLATEVIALLKQKIGDDQLNRAVVECMKIASLKKTKRKQDRAIQVAKILGFIRHNLFTYLKKI